MWTGAGFRDLTAVLKTMFDCGSHVACCSVLYRLFSSIFSAFYSFLAIGYRKATFLGMSFLFSAGAVIAFSFSELKLIGQGISNIVNQEVFVHTLSLRPAHRTVRVKK